MSDPSQLKPKSTSVLLALFQDVYRQEVGAEEDVHRTLPFFATSLGLIIAALNYVSGQLPGWFSTLSNCTEGDPWIRWWTLGFCMAPEAICIAGLLLSAGCAAFVLFSLAIATKKQEYGRVGPESTLLQRAKDLQDYYELTLSKEDEIDEAVSLEFRNQLLNEYAVAIPRNRGITGQRYSWRARAVTYLLWSLFSALLATIVFLSSVQFGFIVKATS